MKTSPKSSVTIDLNALRHNVSVTRSCVPNACIMAMVKANAYGHGALQIIRALPNIDAFGVARLEEALELTEQGIQSPLVIMGGFTNAAELSICAQWGFTPVVHHWDQIALLETAKLSSPIPIWVKIDTGMHRLGIAPEQLNAAVERLLCCPMVKKPLQFMTHLANADQPDHVSAKQQIECFKRAVVWEGARSIANSAAILAWPESHSDWVRPGIILYGVSPFSTKTGEDFNFKPVMTFHSRLIAIQDLPSGAAIGYGSTWTCPCDMRIGIAAVGYGDGYPRHVPSGTPVLVNGIRCSVAGTVSMDLLTIDLRANPSARLGDSVTLWGRGLPVEEIAKYAGTIGYELLCHIGKRVQPFFVTAQAPPQSGANDQLLDEFGERNG